LFQVVSGWFTEAHQNVCTIVCISETQTGNTNMSGNLTASAIKNANPKPDGRPNNLIDGGWLYLHVTTTGKYWRYNYRYNGKMNAGQVEPLARSSNTFNRYTITPLP
jgi:hypothetical protein